MALYKVVINSNEKEIVYRDIFYSLLMKDDIVSVPQDKREPATQ